MDEVAFGRYRLLSLIGEGGMGKVYKAHDTVIDREVAIKVLSKGLGDEPGYRERFRREAHTAARLNEPHIIPIHDTGEIDGQLYLVMPIIEGVDMHDLLERDGPMSPQRAVHIVDQLAAALDAAHAAGLVHRDIKPSNALVTARDFVYLIDFGIAHHAASSKLTRTGIIVGSWAYMAPERFTAGTADARSDVYALACVLHECLTGVQPYPGDSLQQQFGHSALDSPKPSGLNPAVPAAFDRVIAIGMAKDPDQRYQSASDLAAAAHQALVATQPVTQAAPLRSMPSNPRQQTGNQVLAASRQRPPDRGGALPAGTADSQQVQKGPLTVLLVVVLAGAAITGYLLWPDSAPARNPVAVPSGQSVQPSNTSITGAPALNQADVRVYNISATAGLGARVRDQLAATGFKVTDVGNLVVSDVTSTTVYYSDAGGERATADAVGQKLGAPVEARIPALANQPPGVIVLVTG